MAKLLLNALLAELSGEIGAGIVSRRNGAHIFRRKPVYRYPVHQNQRPGIRAFQVASEAWSQLTREEALAWKDYADEWCRRSRVAIGSRSGRSAFISRSTKVLQFGSDRPLPKWPPSEFELHFSGFSLDRNPEDASTFYCMPQEPLAPNHSLEIVVGLMRSERTVPPRFLKSFRNFYAEELPGILDLPQGVLAVSGKLVDMNSGVTSRLIEIQVIRNL